MDDATQAQLKAISDFHRKRCRKVSASESTKLFDAAIKFAVTHRAAVDARGNEHQFMAATRDEKEAAVALQQTAVLFEAGMLADELSPRRTG